MRPVTDLVRTVAPFEVIADYDVQIAGWMRTGALQP